MTKKIILSAARREEKNGNPKLIRSTGLVPAVLYGGDHENELLKIKSIDFRRAYEAAGESSLVDLSIDKDEPVKVIIKDAQFDPIKNSVLHIDFYRVDMNQPIEVEIPLQFTGEAKAVKDLGGTFVKSMETVLAKCLPGDLLEHIEVDLSRLATFDDHIQVKDLVIPANIQILDHESDIVANVLAPRAIEEETTAPAEEVPADVKAAEGETAGQDKKAESKKEGK